jgi:hypothetical protein
MPSRPISVGQCHSGGIVMENVKQLKGVKCIHCGNENDILLRWCEVKDSFSKVYGVEIKCPCCNISTVKSLTIDEIMKMYVMPAIEEQYRVTSENRLCTNCRKSLSRVVYPKVKPVPMPNEVLANAGDVDGEDE